MGVVYRATDLRLKRTVALKVIAPELARKSDFRARFERESSMAAAIDHPNVIPVYHSGEQDGLLFTTMLWVEGLDLGDLIAQEGRLSLLLAADIVSQIAAGLDAAHAGGLIHRDVKPGNILLRPDKREAYHAYLSDFGLTKRVDGTSLTMAGMFVGTVDYVAPEQLLGSQIDRRADVYSLGCVLFHALAGLAPYRGQSDWATLKAHEAGQIPSLCAHRPDLPAQIDEVIARAIAKSPADRYASAGELGRAILAIADGKPMPAPKPTGPSSETSPEEVATESLSPRSSAGEPGIAPETRLARTRGALGAAPTVTRAAQAEETKLADRHRGASRRSLPGGRPLLIGVAATLVLVLVAAALGIGGVFGTDAGRARRITRREVKAIVSQYEIAMEANRADGLRPLFARHAQYLYPGFKPKPVINEYRLLFNEIGKVENYRLSKVAMHIVNYTHATVTASYRYGYHLTANGQSYPYVNQGEIIYALELPEHRHKPEITSVSVRPDFSENISVYSSGQWRGVVRLGRHGPVLGQGSFDIPPNTYRPIVLPADHSRLSLWRKGVEPFAYFTNESNGTNFTNEIGYAWGG